MIHPLHNYYTFSISGYIYNKGSVANPKYIAKLSFGQTDSLFSFRDATIIAKLKQVDSFTNSADVLNYMSKLGWTVVTIAPIKYGGWETEKLYFKKSFDSSEFTQTN